MPRRVSAGDARFRPVGRANPALLPFGRSVGRTRPFGRSDGGVGEPTPSPESKLGVPGEPGSVASRRHIGRPMTVPPSPLPTEVDVESGPPRPGGPPKRTPLPEPEPRSVGRTRLRRLLDAVHADPVSRAIALAPPNLPRSSSWGARPASARSPLRSVPAGRPVAAVLRSWWLLAPFRGRSRLVDPARRRSPPIRRSDSIDPVSQSRLACAPRYGWLLSRTRNPWSSGIFESPGLSPEVFGDPQDFVDRPPAVHRPGRCFPHGCPPFGELTGATPAG